MKIQNVRKKLRLTPRSKAAVRGTNVESGIWLSDTDFRKLTSLLERLPQKQQEKLFDFENELSRAEIVEDSLMPRDVVTMYSTVIYEDLDTGRTMSVQLTYPNDASIEEGRVSVLAPVGAALIGLKVGQEIEWPLPDGRIGRLRIKQVFQPIEDQPREVGT